MSFITNSKLKTLVENLNLEVGDNELPQKVYKFTFSNKENPNATYYVKSENYHTPDAIKKKWLSQMYSDEYKREDYMNKWLAKDPNHVFGVLLKNYNKDLANKLIDVEKIGEFATEEEALLFRKEQSDNDPNSRNKSTSLKVSGRRAIDSTGKADTKKTKNSTTSSASDTSTKNPSLDKAKDVTQLKVQLNSIENKLKNPQGLSKDEIKQLKTKRFEIQKQMDSAKSAFNLPPTRR